MGRQTTIQRDYAISAADLWTDLLSPAALADSMKGAVTYIGLPTEPVQEGQEFTVQLKRWGWLPMGAWTMKVVERDDDNFVLRSEERGNVVKRYRHKLSIIPTGPDTCRYTDHIDVDAGVFTPLVFPMFEKMYLQRHEMRKARLEA